MRPATALLAAATVAAPLRDALAKRILQHNLARLREGDPRPMLRFYADDVHFRFPGDSSWATELRSKPELERWIRRFVAAGLALRADEIVVAGPPWRTTFVLRCTDDLTEPDGTVVYTNRAVLFGHMAWGRVVDYEVYEDTQASAELDARLGAAAAGA